MKSEKIYFNERIREGKKILLKPGESARDIKPCKDAEIIVTLKGNTIRKYYNTKSILVAANSVLSIVYDQEYYNLITIGDIIRFERIDSNG